MILEKEIAHAPSHKLANHLMREIRNGGLKPGEKLGGLRELAKQYDASVAIVRNSFKLLARKDLIISKHGSGTFVNPALKYNGTKLVALLTTCRKQNIEGYFEPLFKEANSANILPLISTLEHTENWHDAVNKVITREPDAVIIDLESKYYRLEEIRELVGNIPHYFVNRWEWNEQIPHDTVLIDYTAGYGTALKYLKDRGHGKIIVVGYHLKSLPFLEEYLNKAAEIARMSFGKELIYYSQEQYYDSADSLEAIYNKHKPTAIFGLSDYLVHQIISGMDEMRNLDKIGFFDLNYSRIPGHEFSTMRVDFEKMWKSTFDMLNCNDVSMCTIKPELICR